MDAFIIPISAVVLVALLTLILKYLRDRKYISPEFFRQVIASVFSGVVVGLVASTSAFNSAHIFWKRQEKARIAEEKTKEAERVKDIRLDFFISVKNEVSENRLTLGQEVKNNAFVRLPLKTSAWEKGKHALPIKTENLFDSLKLLYNDIEKYNWQVQFMQYKVMVEKLTTDKVSREAKTAQTAIDTDLLNKLLDLDKLTSRELVLLDQITEEDYTKIFGEWEDSVDMPYFKNP